MVKYRVFVTPTGTRPPFQADTMDSGLTQYNLSPDLCDGSTYWFTVAAVDRCERQGPIGQPVSINCSKDMGVRGSGDSQSGLVLL